MLTITKLNGAEYLLTSVAAGLEDYYMGAGEAPGVWRGAWAAQLGLQGVVEPDDLRALVNGQDPASGANWLAGHRERKVRAVDVTLSVPKSVSLLWAFGTPQTSAAVSLAVVEATDTALQFMEERAAVARVQEGGIRRRVGTDGFAVATFAHRTSRAGDPQLHTHCLIPNIVHRADRVHVAFDANPAHVWGKATGTVFLNQLERTLTERLGWRGGRNTTAPGNWSASVATNSGRSRNGPKPSKPTWRRPGSWLPTRTRNACGPMTGRRWPPVNARTPPSPRNGYVTGGPAKPPRSVSTPARQWMTSWSAAKSTGWKGRVRRRCSPP
jgi:conjugative relaxase-like TrwC/TraI family protein